MIAGVARSTALLTAAMSLALGACTGQVIGDGATGGPAFGPFGQPGQAGQPGALQPSTETDTEAVGFRRLTREQYRNTLTQLLGLALTDITLPQDGSVGIFSSNEAVHTDQFAVERYMEVAEDLSAAIDVASLAPCADPTSGASACGKSFVRAFGRRAFRRSITDEIAAPYEQLFEAELSSAGYQAAIRMVVRTMLQSAYFLYTLELHDGKSGIRSLDGHEIAARLAFFLWDSMPDEALLAAADAGELFDPGALAAQAERLLQSESARPVIARFHREWLGLARLTLDSKDRSVLATFDEALLQSMHSEVQQFATSVLFSEAPTVQRLLLSPLETTDARLAAHYATGQAMPASRQGILMSSAFLAAQAGAVDAMLALVRRGDYIRKNILCDERSIAVPPNVPAFDDQVIVGDLSPRQKWEQAHLATNPSCAGCHSQLDPLGFPFESFDTLGRWRNVYYDGHAIEPAGAVIGTDDADGPVANAFEFVSRIATSRTTRQCVASQWLKFALTRELGPRDARTQGSLSEVAEASGGNVREMLAAIVLSDAFRFSRQTED